jgi:hypothetical protein
MAVVRATSRGVRTLDSHPALGLQVAMNDGSTGAGARHPDPSKGHERDSHLCAPSQCSRYRAGARMPHAVCRRHLQGMWASGIVPGSAGGQGAWLGASGPPRDRSEAAQGPAECRQRRLSCLDHAVRWCLRRNTSAPVSGASKNAATRTVTSVAEGLTAEWTCPVTTNALQTRRRADRPLGSGLLGGQGAYAVPCCTASTYSGIRSLQSRIDSSVRRPRTCLNLSGLCGMESVSYITGKSLG